jgi:hypothetical protein
MFKVCHQAICTLFIFYIYKIYRNFHLAKPGIMENKPGVDVQWLPKTHLQRVLHPGLGSESAHSRRGGEQPRTSTPAQLTGLDPMEEVHVGGHWDTCTELHMAGWGSTSAFPSPGERAIELEKVLMDREAQDDVKFSQMGPAVPFAQTVEQQPLEMGAVQTWIKRRQLLIQTDDLAPRAAFSS